MAYFEYGVITPNGPVPNVTIISPNSFEDMQIAMQVAGHHDKSYDATLPGVHRSEMGKRFAQDGATECRYFPKENVQ